jgi:hypothetical protein
MDVYEDKLSPTSAVVDVSAVVDRTSHTFIVFTQIFAEKARRLVRRGGFFAREIKSS